MQEKEPSTDLFAPVEVDLKDRTTAALLAWLWPGAGHIYQQRYAKGILFMVCILSTFFFGLTIGGGHVVYASWTKTDYRLQYVCQLGTGLPAMPALIQNYLVMHGKEPLFGSDIMAPPEQPVRPDGKDQLAEWHETYHSFFELGTYYTVIAGLLNILVIYDAFAGPVFIDAEEKEKKTPPPDSPNQPPPGNR